MRQALLHLSLIAVFGLAASGFTAVGMPSDVAAPRQDIVRSDRLPTVPDQDFTAAVLKVPPGAAVSRHHHAGFVFAYVLNGSVCSGLDGAHPRVYGPGDSFIERPGTIHTAFKNPSQTEVARLLVVFVVPEGAALTAMDP